MLPRPPPTNGSSSSSVSGSGMSTTSTVREPSLVEAEQAARDEGDESSLANILLNRMVVETWAGRWDEAEALAARMADAFAQQGVESEGVGPWRVYVDAHAGRFEAVQAAFELARPDEPIVTMIWNRCIGLAALAAGEREEADRHLAQALAELDRVDFREPAIWRVDGDAIEAAIMVGALDRADVPHRAFRGTRPNAHGSPGAWPSRRVAAVFSWPRGGDLEGAAGSSGAGARRARALPDAVRAGSHAARRRADPPPPEAEASGAWRRSSRRWRSFAGSDAERWVRRTEAELARVAVRRAPDELSATELRIARLAASGSTNQEIATQVFLTA